MSTSSSAPLPRSALTSALVTISTAESRTASTVRWCARNASRRCTRVTVLATGSRCSAQSKALSPPPTITTSLPAYGAKLGTKNSSPLPSQPSPAGSARGLNLPMPAVISTAPAVISVPSSRPMVTESPSCFRDSAVRSRKYSGSAVAACATSPSTRSRPLMVGKPGDVEDRLLRVHRGDLAAELGQRVDHRHPQPAEARVVGGEQARGACADDKEVGFDGGHDGDPSPPAQQAQLERVLVSQNLVAPAGMSRTWGTALLASRCRRPASRCRCGPS